MFGSTDAIHLDREMHLTLRGRVFDALTARSPHIAFGHAVDRVDRNPSIYTVSIDCAAHDCGVGNCRDIV